MWSIVINSVIFFSCMITAVSLFALWGSHRVTDLLSWAAATFAVASTLLGFSYLLRAFEPYWVNVELSWAINMATALAAVASALVMPTAVKMLAVIPQLTQIRKTNDCLARTLADTVVPSESDLRDTPRARSK